MSDLLLSVVIIGRNEGKRLKRCLESIAGIRGVAGRIELVYSDSGSTDGSPELAKSFGADVIAVNAERPTAALGRNAGLSRAHAPYILFLDGDTVLDPDFARTALDALQNDQSIAAVWGHRREIHPELSLYNRVLDLDWIFPPGDAQFCGGDVVMRRSALDEVQGYDPALIAGEEPELCRRLRARGYRILHIDCPMTGHDLAMTAWTQYWRRATRAGHAYAEVSSRFASTEDPFWRAESRANLLRGGFWMGSFAFAVLALSVTSWVLAVWVAIVLSFASRSSLKNRWKAPGKPLLLAVYGLHSHLQQIPIFLGQLQFYRDRRRGRKRRLIEYKEGSCD
jgi:glycosyltransferase involved in cell wall biosynthesis